jgi:4-hydroxy-2-oxoheptanedioate aldolase
MLSPLVVETVGRTGIFDYVEVVVEYGTYDVSTLENMARAAELYSMGTMIKVHGNDRLLAAQRAVAAGFESVLFAESRSTDDVRHCVRTVRPDTPSERGLAGAGARRYIQPGYVTSSDFVSRLRSIVVGIMIEKPSAVEELDEIVNTPGVDMVVFGPTDYSISIGRPGESQDAEVQDVGRRVVEACRAARVCFRAEVESIPEVQYFLDLGVQDFCLGGDLRTIYSSLKANGTRLREMVTDAGLAQSQPSPV